jgi:hypothetical protein
MRELFRTNELGDSNQRVPEWAWLVRLFLVYLVDDSTDAAVSSEPDAIICALVYLIRDVVSHSQRWSVWSDSIVSDCCWDSGTDYGDYVPMAFVFTV